MPVAALDMKQNLKKGITQSCEAFRLPYNGMITMTMNVNTGKILN